MCAIAGSVAAPLRCTRPTADQTPRRTSSNRSGSDVVQTETVRKALANIGAVYAALRPAERKELMQLVLQRVEVNERQIVLEIYGGACTLSAQTPAVASNKSGSRSEAPVWLPGQDSNLQPIG